MPTKTILVADDDPGILDVTKIILEEAGFRVQTAPDAAATFTSIKEDTPDLLLLDIWLAGENGVTIAQVIKKEKATQHIPIIMVSANNNVEKMSKDAGADGFISKPFDIDDLQNLIYKHVGKPT